MGTTQNKTTGISLWKIAKRSGAIKKYLHSFCDRYDQLFSSIRHRQLTILEIGVGGYKNKNKGGGSLRMWAEYFPDSTIVGVDNCPKELDLPKNVNIAIGSQTDTNFLMNLSKSYLGFDIVIDDASHVTENTILTFEILCAQTRLFYIVEDLHMSKAVGTKEYFKTIKGADFITENLCVISQ